MPLVLCVHLRGHSLHQQRRPSVSVFPVEEEQVRQFVSAENFHLGSSDKRERENNRVQRVC